MATSIKADLFGLNKASRLLAKSASQREENARAALEPSFPFSVDPIGKSFWRQVLEGGDASLIQSAQNKPKQTNSGGGSFVGGGGSFGGAGGGGDL